MNNIENKGDFGFVIKITIANILTYWMSTIPPMVIEPQLTHSSISPQHYPLVWVIFPIGVALGAVTFFVMTRKQKDRCVLWNGLSFSAASILALLFFPPFPHGYVVIVSVLFLFLSVLTVWIHYHPLDAAYASDKTIDRAARLEWMKVKIQFWHHGLFGFVAAYLALLVSWFQRLHEFSLQVSTDLYEQQWFEGLAGSFIGITSVWLVFGPLAEAAKKRQEAQNLFLKIEA